MTTYSYNPADSASNIGSLTKDSTEKPSYFIDFAAGLISDAVTLLTATAVGVSSTNATITTQVVDTTSISGTVVRVDLRTGGASGPGTGPATDGDQYKVSLSVQPSSGGPLDFDVFVNIDAPTYGPV